MRSSKSIAPRMRRVIRPATHVPLKIKKTQGVKWDTSADLPGVGFCPAFGVYRFAERVAHLVYIFRRDLIPERNNPLNETSTLSSWPWIEREYRIDDLTGVMTPAL